jgi:hypothetical protein
VVFVALILLIAALGLTQTPGEVGQASIWVYRTDMLGNRLATDWGGKYNGHRHPDVEMDEGYELNPPFPDRPKLDK